MSQVSALPSVHSPTLPALPAQLIFEEFPNWSCQRGARSRRTKARLQLAQKHHFPSLKLPSEPALFEMWEAACAYRSISKGQDGDKRIVLSLDPGPKISLPSWSRLGEMLSTATAGEQWKGPSLLALQHLGCSSVWYLDQDLEERTSYLP